MSGQNNIHGDMDEGATGMQGVYCDSYDSPVGKITMISDGTAIKKLWIEGQQYVNGLPDRIEEKRDISVFMQTREWLDIYFAGKCPDFLPPLSPEGSAFRRRVWEILLEIPYGTVRTYGDIAAQIAKETGKDRMSAQAVGGAVGHNPISILIPCHRVVGKDGSLVGYDGGLDKKDFLLGLENNRCTDGRNPVQ